MYIYNKRSKDHTPRAPEAFWTQILNGIGRRGFIQQKKVAKIRLRLVGVASFYWPRQIMIVQRRAYQLQKRSASYGGDYKLIIVPVHS